MMENLQQTSGPRHLPPPASFHRMTPCLGCVSCLLCRDERVQEACLVCCSAPSHTSTFPAALQPSPIITDARSGSLIYILCHMGMQHTFYLLPCVLSAEHCALSKTHTHTHSQLFDGKGQVAEQSIYLPASSTSVCKIIGEQHVICGAHEKVLLCSNAIYPVARCSR